MTLTPSNIAVLTKPCKDCPFRKDIHSFLGSNRAKEIIENISNDHHVFHCHKTLDKPKSERPQCFGSQSIMYKSYNHTSILTRLLIASGHLTADILENNEEVFDDDKQFIKHHAKVWRK